MARKLFSPEPATPLPAFESFPRLLVLFLLSSVHPLKRKLNEKKTPSKFRGAVLLNFELPRVRDEDLKEVNKSRKNENGL